MKPAATTLIRRLGFLGIISMLSYTAAVFFSPAAYPGYNWMAQAVSDLSATDSPSRELWNQLASLYNVCGLVTLTLCCVFVQGKLTRTLRAGVYLFALMSWVSAVGYTYFPLTESGYAGTFQDIMHMVVTAAVVLLSIGSLVTLIVGGFRRHALPSLAVCASVALGMMFTGSIGLGAAPKELFGVFERFSVFSAVCFTAVLGIYLMLGFPSRADARQGV
jgi:hypothetical membrane protein